MEANPNLRFSEMRFCCVYGGRGDKSVKSNVQGCEMHIRFGMSEDCSQLVVKSLCEEHNHDVYENMGIRETLHPQLCR